ncbi:hypothetical protein DUI87_16453 [Hirundo rustica rustica]|uniref:Uncharacterized protein n=1 Tax=Hirundo rustica rustica TaxID=333673 RepID=A0A3M0K7G3_HIRRU|nr:hypothetical protein DUI87_16453 [Hirundo rustica rustica]
MVQVFGSQKSGVSEPSEEQIETTKNNGQHLDFVSINHEAGDLEWCQRVTEMMKTLLTSSFETTDPIRDNRPNAREELRTREGLIASF